jgi:catechol 2,3-dioxygenase-like lactoylglutathione lyase family enzyme
LLGLLLTHSRGIFAAVGVSAVDSIAVSVSDVARSEDFYTRVLSFHKVADREVSGAEYERVFGIAGVRVRAVRMQLGNESIELLQFLTPRGRPVPVDSHSNDRWFQHIAIIVSDMDAAYARLRSFGVRAVSTAPQRLPDWNPSAAGIRAFYFRDPDEHNLEILQFPPGKGRAKWQQRGGGLFLGIDHTAIVVSNTTASLHYYRDLLGLQVAGESENYGTEQEHLNNVSGAHLHITSLRAQHGPGVEFLQYLVPRTGRPIPFDTQANDLWAWHIIMRVSDPGALERELQAAHTLDVPGVTELHDSALGWRDLLVSHDPDGHATLIADGGDALANEAASPQAAH